MAMETVDVWRLFTMADGTSSMEAVKVKMEGGRASKLFKGDGVEIRFLAQGTPSWHTGPRRQMIATITGEGELETGDGKILKVKPGIITLIEDLTGKGHLTRNAPEGRLCVFMPLDPEIKIE